MVLNLDICKHSGMWRNKQRRRDRDWQPIIVRLPRIVRQLMLCVLVLFVATAALGCGESDGQSTVLSVRRAKAALKELPFRYSFSQAKRSAGASGAIAGKVSGPKNTSFAFSLALGKHAAPIPVPESGVGNAVGVPSAGFTFNSNTLVKRADGTFAPSRELNGQVQLNVAGQMQFEIEEHLCRVATHKPCPV